MVLRKGKNRKFIIYILIGLVVVAVIRYSGIIINTTPSMPIGVYYRNKNFKKICSGDYVTAKLPFYLQEFGVKRGYIKNNKTELIKEVIAVPGDDVIITNSVIEVNGKRYKAPVHLYDPSHHPLSHIKRGKYPRTDGYWLYGFNDVDGSWDSRYYGPVKLKNITGLAYSVLVFSKDDSSEDL